MFSQEKTKTLDETKKEQTEELYVQGSIYPVGFPDVTYWQPTPLPMWEEPWEKFERVKDMFKSAEVPRFRVQRSSFRENGKARNISRLRMLTPDQPQETAIERTNNIFDEPQLPLDFPEMAGFAQVPVTMPHLIYQGIVDPLETQTGTARETTSGFLENTITKVGDWFLTLQQTKYQADLLTQQQKLAEAQAQVKSATTQANISAMILPLGVIGLFVYLFTKKKGVK